MYDIINLWSPIQEDTTLAAVQPPHFMDYATYILSLGVDVVVDQSH